MEEENQVKNGSSIQLDDGDVEEQCEDSSLERQDDQEEEESPEGESSPGNADEDYQRHHDEYNDDDIGEIEAQEQEIVEAVQHAQPDQPRNNAFMNSYIEKKVEI